MGPVVLEAVQTRTVPAAATHTLSRLSGLPGFTTGLSTRGQCVSGWRAHTGELAHTTAGPFPLPQEGCALGAGQRATGSSPVEFCDTLLPPWQP